MLIINNNPCYYGLNSNLAKSPTVGHARTALKKYSAKDLLLKEFNNKFNKNYTENLNIFLFL